jgi:hypothetical protein
VLQCEGADQNNNAGLLSGYRKPRRGNLAPDFCGGTSAQQDQFKQKETKT